MPTRPQYHHGHLRRAVLDAAIEVISTEGPAALSLRDLARRAGVSHAAPAHHFKDKAGLLTELAIEGNELLAASLAEVLDGDESRLDELGVRYVRFALDHPAHFEVMFRPDLYHRDAPALAAAQDRTSALLRRGVRALPRERRGEDTELAVIAAWSIAHGFATLWRTDNLGGLVGDRSPAETFRSAALLLFSGDTPAHFFQKENNAG